ncbi:hypothetical protein [Roseibacillus persicicus]|uniref:IS110 family transposase n=1 Tax=Roseibacillus persicicus TaxID=454148 RepID=A0A918U0D9_9BACT|nr:hypothetical protein [Roseibacillus persicicus]GHC67790.1 hypothetical protein GCM10007100_39910 [Roseibacillus persicicus]
MSKTTESETAPKAKVIYLGIDAHLDKYVVVRQVDGLSPQPAQTFRSENSLLQWVASYTDLCPNEFSSGGNRLLRNYLVEAAWRLIRWQPEYQQASGGRRKRIVVALARILAVDLWRLVTEQTTLENLGLQPANPA